MRRDIVYRYIMCIQAGMLQLAVAASDCLCVV